MVVVLLLFGGLVLLTAAFLLVVVVVVLEGAEGFLPKKFCAVVGFALTTLVLPVVFVGFAAVVFVFAAANNIAVLGWFLDGRTIVPSRSYLCHVFSTASAGLVSVENPPSDGLAWMWDRSRWL